MCFVYKLSFSFLYVSLCKDREGVVGMLYSDCIHFLTNPETRYPYYRWSSMLDLFENWKGDMLKGWKICPNIEINSQIQHNIACTNSYYNNTWTIQWEHWKFTQTFLYFKQNCYGEIFFKLKIWSYTILKQMHNPAN